MATLYVKEQGTTLNREGDRIVGWREGTVVLEVPAMHVDRLMLFGNVHLTTPLSALLLDRGIDTVLLSARGRYRGRLLGVENGQALLRRRQYETVANKIVCLELAKQMVTAKMCNQAVLIVRRKSRDLRENAGRIRRLIGRARGARNMDALRGYEGAAARDYFQAFGKMLKNRFAFSGRAKRPPTDPVNALLSLGYTLLYADMMSALYSVGLDPFAGFLHQEKPGHAALASDAMEEFRIPVVDVVVLSLCNRGAISPGDFRIPKHGGKVHLQDRVLKRLFAEYERRMATRVTVPALGLQFSYRAALEQQAHGLAQVLTGKRQSYVPFTMK